MWQGAWKGGQLGIRDKVEDLREDAGGDREEGTGQRETHTRHEGI